MLFSLLSCRETVARLDDYLDRELSSREQTLVARHLKICHRCAREFCFESDLLEKMQYEFQHVEISPDLKERIFALLPAESNAQK